MVVVILDEERTDHDGEVRASLGLKGAQRHSPNLAGVALKVVTLVNSYHKMFFEVNRLVSISIYIVSIGAVSLLILYLYQKVEKRLVKTSN